MGHVKLCLKLWIVSALAVGISACSEAKKRVETPITLVSKAGTAELKIKPYAVESGFPLINSEIPAVIFVSENEHDSVKLAVSRVAKDLEALSGQAVSIVDELPEDGAVLVVATLGNSEIAETFRQNDPNNFSDIDGVWEGYVQSVLSEPVGLVSKNTHAQQFVIMGADNRGAIFGLFDMIERAGVSPWAWWADVPIHKVDNLYVAPSRVMSAPGVKYRGIFLNDENPALYGWAHEKYGGFNADFYDRVFELILRNKGNYIWPAMWGKAIYDDDPQNKVTAARNGIILGTSHHEPLMRAHIEWERYGEGAWDYGKNSEALKKFWRGGMERIGEEDVLVTIGMRGDGDEAMSEDTAIELLENVVADQRDIIADVTGKAASETPQIWALYKEVQDYYDQGMSVPDDVLLLFADDNWGQLRRLPKLGEERKGGYGVYYHFDYVGGVRNYKWLNTTQIERVWDQMSIARQYGADALWITNVGDLKPMELPIDFFLDYAWDPEAWPIERLPEFTTKWAEQQFGPKHATKIAKFVDLYTKYNSRRKPELIDQNTYSLVHFDEFKKVVEDYDTLLKEVEAVRAQLSPEYLDAYNQLVWYPIAANANLNALYYAAARNKRGAEQGRISTNDMATLTETLFNRDSEITRFYHEDIADGKWNHFGSQTHIGYTYWQQPEEQVMPSVSQINNPEDGKLGAVVAGIAEPAFDGQALSLLGFDSVHNQKRYIEIFNTGRLDKTFTATSPADWIKLSQTKGQVDGETRLYVSIDWDKYPAGKEFIKEYITISTVNGGLVSKVKISAHKIGNTDKISGYFPNANMIGIAAQNPTCASAPDTAKWTIVPNLGLEASSISLMPATYSNFASDNPSLSYDFHVMEPGNYEVHAYLSPTLDFSDTGSVDFSIALDKGPDQPQRFTLTPHTPEWDEAVSHNAIIGKASFNIQDVGRHTLHLKPQNPGLVFQKIAIGKDGLPPSYFGPPMSRFVGEKRRCAEP